MQYWWLLCSIIVLGAVRSDAGALLLNSLPLFTVAMNQYASGYSIIVLEISPTAPANLFSLIQNAGASRLTGCVPFVHVCSDKETLKRLVDSVVSVSSSQSGTLSLCCS
jgi:hypothetical protein